MRHLLRRAFSGATAISAVLCVAMCFMWVRSYRVVDEFEWFSRTELRHADSRWGQVHVSYDWGCDFATLYHFEEDYEGLHYHRYANSCPSKQDRYLSGWGGIRHHWNGWGFRWFLAEGGLGMWGIHTTPAWDLALPDWAIAIFCAGPAMWLFRLRRQKRTKLWSRLGCCLACGYDLRATLDRCPECGAVPTTKGARFRESIRIVA